MTPSLAALLEGPPSGTIPDWTGCNVDGDVVAQIAGSDVDAQNYADAWNDCAARAERYDLIIVALDGADDTHILVRIIDPAKQPF